MFASIRQRPGIAPWLVLAALGLATWSARAESGVPPTSELSQFPWPVAVPCEQVAEVAGNLVINGSFECREAGQPPHHIETLTPGSKDLAGWEIIDPLGKPSSDVVQFGEVKEDLRTEGWTIDWIGPTRWQASHGRQCLDLDGGVRQTLATVPGRAYELRFDAGANPEQGPNVANLRVLIDDESHDFKFDSTGKSAGDLGWAAQRIQFRAQRKETTLTFFNTNPTPRSAGVALDNVVVLDEDQVAKTGQARGERYRVTETSQGPILLDTQTGQTWRLTTQEVQPVWLPIPRADKPAPDATNPRRDE